MVCASVVLNQPQLFFVTDEIGSFPAPDSREKDFVITCCYYDWDGRELNRTPCELRIEYFKDKQNILPWTFAHWNIATMKRNSHVPSSSVEENTRLITQPPRESRCTDTADPSFVKKKGASFKDPHLHVLMTVTMRPRVIQTRYLKHIQVS